MEIQNNDIPMFLDMLDLDEEAVNKKLASFMTRKDLSQNELSNIVNIFKYKLLLNTKEDVEYENDTEIDCASLILKQVTPHNVSYVSQIIMIALCLNEAKLQCQAQHFMQQIWSEILLKQSDLTKSNVSEDDIQMLLVYVKIFDAVLDALYKKNMYATLFENIPVESLLEINSESLTKHLLVNTFRKYMKCVKNNCLLDKIWKFIEKNMSCNLQRVLLVLCPLSGYYLPLPDESGNYSHKSKVMNCTSFWQIISDSLDNEQVHVRKCGFFLLKRSLDLLLTNKENDNICLPNPNNIYISWRNSCERSSVQDAFANFFSLFECLEETQSNIILSALPLFEKIASIHVDFVTAAVNLGLQHNNNVINEEMINIYSKCGFKARNDRDIVIMLTTLNKICISYSNTNYVEYNKRLFYNFFQNEANVEKSLNNMKNIQWSPISLFYSIYALSRKVLERKINNDKLIEFLQHLANIPCNNTVLRSEVLCNVLKFLKLNCAELNLKNIIKIINIVKPFENNIEGQQIIITLLDEHISDITFNNFDLSETNLDLLCLYYRAFSDDSSKLKAINDFIISIQKDINDAVELNRDIIKKLKWLHRLYQKNLRGIRYDSINVNKKFNINNMASIDILDVKDFEFIEQILPDDFKNFPLLSINAHSPSQIYMCYRVASWSEDLDIFFPIDDVLNSIKDIFNSNFDKSHKDIILEEQFKALNISMQPYNKPQFHSGINKILIDVLVEVFNLGFKSSYSIALDTSILLMNEVDFDTMEKFLRVAWNEIEAVKSTKCHKKCVKSFMKVINTKTKLRNWNLNKLYFEKIVTISSRNLHPLFWFLYYCDDIKLLIEIIMITSSSRKDQRQFAETINIFQDSYPCKINTIEASDYIDDIAFKMLILQKISDSNNIIIDNFHQRIDEAFKNKNRYHANSDLHRFLFRSLQHLLYVTKCVYREYKYSEKQINWYLSLLAKLPHQPSVRFALEWIISVHIVETFEFESTLIEYLEGNQLPQVSILTILYLTTKWHLNNHSQLLYNKKNDLHSVLDYFFSFTMGQQFNIRLNAQFMALSLCNLLSEGFKQMYQHTCQIIETTFQACQHEKALINLKENVLYNQFDIYKNLTSRTIYYVLPKYTGMADEILDFERNKHMWEIIYRSEGREEIKLPLYEAPNKRIILNNCMKDVNNIQKKFIPWQNMLGEFGLGDKDRKRSGLILVASLVDKIPNLGGLARTSEIFAVEKYVISNTNLVQEREFQGLSVSADKWIDIEEVRPGDALRSFIEEKKAEGYRIVGAEQTASSKTLNSYQFPFRTVLVMGHEKEGIPCDLLPYMDDCVEVPQRGVIRSLNVHVTAAIFVWEYVRQHLT